ncbi:MAG: hypothetical protein ACRDGD_08250 [Candidatus Limnocylindria bacterium]
MIEPDVLFSPLAIAGFAAGVIFALVAGMYRKDPPGLIAMSAIGSGLALAALAWANDLGDGALFAAAAVGFGASLWTIGNERSGRRTIR